MLTLAPLDEETICESVRRTQRLVVVDEDTPRRLDGPRHRGAGRRPGLRLARRADQDGHGPDTPVPFAAVLEAEYIPHGREGRRRRARADRVTRHGACDRDAELRDVHAEGTLAQWLKPSGAEVAAGEVDRGDRDGKGTGRGDGARGGILHHVVEPGRASPGRVADRVRPRTWRALLQRRGRRHRCPQRRMPVPRPVAA